MNNRFSIVLVNKKKELMTILHKILGNGYGEIEKIVMNGSKGSSSELGIYEDLLGYYLKKGARGEKVSSARGKGIAQSIKAVLLQKRLPIKELSGESEAYLDIGANDCTITKEVGNIFGYSSKQIYGVEVGEEIEYLGKHDYSVRKKEELGCNYVLYDGRTLPFKDETFNLVTVLMVLHHIKNADATVKEIMRVLRPGGIVVIREHNCDSVEMSALIDIEHLVYGMIKEKEEVSEEMMDSYVAWYKTIGEWNDIFAKNGFRVYRPVVFGKSNPNGAYYSVFQKKKSI